MMAFWMERGGEPGHWHRRIGRKEFFAVLEALDAPCFAMDQFSMQT